jgi:DNA polymerase-3 subunit gamma/tau
VTTALYRRYRPESFAEMIGQSQVTEPLMTALRGDRVGHAYLFSGPRGCGKTTSARILARCLNCAQGPTDTPCGECDSCIELGRGGGGSLDVVEIDAASHNGVDDARDLRERAVFAPARDRFKIFILDEAHMVTPQGFNALLKLVEEPPEHVKFIFATTEPEKVIGTIRSRTHHYPFRLVAPAAMLEYVEQLCAQEGVQVEPGVLPLVVRAGGGSPRDTLSVLDQLIAGSESGAVSYQRAVALLGYTPAELLDEVVDAFGAQDAGAAFSAVDRVIQTGQDPRRFVDDLLERLRDLIIVAATGEGASAVLRGVPADELERMSHQATAFGAERLSRIADIVVSTLDEMTGATSPRLQLELMVARVLAHGAPAAAASAAEHPQRVDTAAAPAAAPAAPRPGAQPTSPAAERPEARPASGAQPTPAAGDGPAVQPTSASADRPAVQPTPAAERPSEPDAAPRPAGAPSADTPPQGNAPAQPTATSPAPPASAPVDERAQRAETTSELEPAPPAGPVTLERIHEAWPDVLRRLEAIDRSSWLVACAASATAFADDVLTLNFASAADVAKFKKLQAGAGPSEDLRQAIKATLGVRVKYIARHTEAGGPASGGPGDGGPGRGPAPTHPAAPAPSGNAPSTARPAPRPSVASPDRGGPTAAQAAPVTDWAVAPIPQDTEARAGQFAVDDEPEDAASARSRVATLAPPREGEVLPTREVETSVEPDDDEREAEELGEQPAPIGYIPPVATIRDDGVERVGEAVVRQVLGATFLREEPYESPTRFQ